MGRWHAHYAQQLGAEVAAVVDGSSRAASLLAARTRTAAVFDDMGTMLEALRPQVVHLCTPLASHRPLALRAIEAGAHAFVEKPLTSLASETQALLQCARERGVQVCPVHQFAFQSGVIRAREALEGLGEALHASFTICSAGGDERSRDLWDPIVADILPHPLSVLQALWPGNPLEPSGWSAASDRAGELHVRGRSGAIPVHAWISMNARPTRCDLEITCSGGSVHVNFFHGYATVRRGSPSQLDKIGQPFLIAAGTVATAAINLAARAWRREPAYPGLRALMGAFYAAARGVGSNPVPMECALAVAVVREHLIREAIPGALREAGDGGRRPAAPGERDRSRASP